MPRLAEAIRELCGKWKIRPYGTADDSIFARARGHTAATIADEFSAAGVIFTPAEKGTRKAGWERMRTLLSQAGSPDLPGLYISRACGYAWATLPTIPRDQDLDSGAPDHAADALRYGVIWTRRGAGASISITGGRLDRRLGCRHRRHPGRRSAGLGIYVGSAKSRSGLRAGSVEPNARCALAEELLCLGQKVHGAYQIVHTVVRHCLPNCGDLGSPFAEPARERQ
ncbi:MAG: hypothetical protein K0S81_3948 [Rhodospirillales bacterium]|nr:hypothetical protein [Rhodospirillales bacterium]